jgi:hypothetical protein
MSLRVRSCSLKLGQDLNASSKTGHGRPDKQILILGKVASPGGATEDRNIAPVNTSFILIKIVDGLTYSQIFLPA